MKQGKTREELEGNLNEIVISLKRKKLIPQRIKNTLLKNNKIIGGNVQNLLNNPKEELPKIDWRFLFLFAEQVYIETKEENNNFKNINPKNYYTEIEIKKARQYTGKLTIEGDITLPLTFENVLQIDYNQYVTKIPAKLLAEMSALLLNYNFDIQRESKRKIIGGETIQEATLIMDNVMEMKEHLKNNTLETTNIVINASAGTSDSGNEIAYDSERRVLTINEGTVLDIVDGFHRCKASELAINENPDIEFNFIVLFLNYTDDQAAKYQGQLAKATPIAQTRQKQLAESRYADTIVKKLNTQSELRGKISTHHTPSLKNGELVSYDLLANTINNEFNLIRVVDSHLVGDYLKNIFDIVLGYYEDEFLIRPLDFKKTSLITESNMFIGILVLASKMYYNNIEPSKIIRYMDKIDYNRNNKLWKEMGVLEDSGNLTTTEVSRQAIKSYFENIEV